MKKETVGGRIRMLRSRERITQGGLASRLGIERASVSNWERDVNTPSHKHLIELARMLKTTVVFILTGEVGNGEPDEKVGGSGGNMGGRFIPLLA